MTAFVNKDAPAGLFEQPWSDGVHWVRLPVGIGGKAHLAAQMTVVPASAARRRLDVLHSLANIGPLVTPGVARVVTLLDVIWLITGRTGSAARRLAASPRSRGSARGTPTACSRSRNRQRRTSPRRSGSSRAEIDVAPLGVRAQEPRTELPQRAGCPVRRAEAAVQEPRQPDPRGRRVEEPRDARPRRRAHAARGGAEGAGGRARRSRSRALPRLGLRGRARGALPRAALLRAAVADRGLRAAGARGDVARHARRRARTGRRCRRSRGTPHCSSTPRTRSAVTPALWRLLEDGELARTLAERGRRAGARLHLGADRAGDARVVPRLPRPPRR